jgi:peptidoglycan/LPS O-acetylase OafA/YrhL
MVPSDINKIRQANNFDFLRFISSLFVIISHCYSLTGKEDKELLMVISRQTYHFSSLGLICFFVISGYLVSQSLFNSASILNYAWKRILRIVPGLCGVILFSLFVIGPAFSALAIPDYFLSIHTWSYLRNVFFIFPLQWDLPGLFMNNVEKSVNGSLWTLTLEGRLYILLVLLFLLRLFSNKIIITLIFIMLVILSPLFNVVFRSASPFPFYFALDFFAGVVASLYKKKIKYNKWLFLLALSIIILRCFSEAFNSMTLIAFPYLVLYIAQLPSRLNRFGRYGDFSYGMFLYAFPVQQCIIQLTKGNIPIVPLIFLSILLTLPFAILSWKFIESKALKQKHLVK